MTSQLRKKLPITALNSARPEKISNSDAVTYLCSETRQRFWLAPKLNLSRIVCYSIVTTAGWLNSAFAFGQNSWSPEPFKPVANIRPLSSEPSRANQPVPANSLRGDRTSSGNSNADAVVVLRWISQSKSQAFNRQTSESQPSDFASNSGAVVRSSQSKLSYATNEDVFGDALNPQADDSDELQNNDSSVPVVAKRTIRPNTAQSNSSLNSRVQQVANWTRRSHRDESVRVAQFEAPPAVGNAAPAEITEPLSDFPPFNSPSKSILPLGGEENNNATEALDNMLNERMNESNTSKQQPDTDTLLPPKADDLFPKRDTPRKSPSDLDRPPTPPRERSGDLDKDAPPKQKSKAKTDVDCDDVRSRVLSADIDNIKLDVSPDFGVGPKDKTPPMQKKTAFATNAPERDWQGTNGESLAFGRLVDLTNDDVVIESTSGARQRLALRSLSDADTVYVYESWGLPVTCSLGRQAGNDRFFEPTTMAWKASGLCHKPLYFEDIQLERYGHEWGPVVQPALSTVHFFKDVAVLPYKMGINPWNECQYALGYYRVGNCAPWTIDPVPLSLRGLAAEGAVIGGAVLVLP